MDLKQHIRHVPDFPKAGILFYDITTLLRNAEGFAMTVDMIASPFVGQGIDAVVGIESRGFILGAAVAERIKAERRWVYIYILRSRPARIERSL